MPDYPFLFDDECFSRPASARPSVPLRREPARSENVLGVGAAVARIRSALGGMLGGALSAGVLLAIMMANAGGAWDNAYI